MSDRYARPEPNAAAASEGDGAAPDSRRSKEGAGWEEPSRAAPRVRPSDRRAFSWLDPRPLWASRNELIARALGDPTNEHRQRWIAQLPRAEPDRVIRVPGDKRAFLLMGDTGEGDASQQALVAPLLSQSADTAFLFLCSDVVYPAGGLEEYDDKLLSAYRDYRGPIYAIPGNHDWYDDAEGFMYWFCGARERPRRRLRVPFSRGWWRDGLWRRSPQGRTQRLERMARLREMPGQPGPYFAVDVGSVRLVAVDAGLGGPLDSAQGKWLERVSKDPRPKLLATGKPLYVNGREQDRPIEDGRTLRDVVTDPRHNYLGTIAGDTHNYQRYRVRTEDGRLQMHIVSGGGGAFMHETHTLARISPVECGGATEEDFRCYPLRGDSLARYSELFARRIGAMGGRLVPIPPDEAAKIVGERIGVMPTRPAARHAHPSRRQRRSAKLVFALSTRPQGWLYFPVSVFLDWNDAPLFKHFLHVRADPGELVIRCHGVTGRSHAEHDPPVEDLLVARPDAHGRWRWQE